MVVVTSRALLLPLLFVAWARPALTAAPSWADVDVDLSASNVVVSPLARTSTERPAMLVYLAGHLRTFLLIAPQMKALFDAIAGADGSASGQSYVVYMHTWDELDHGDAVWWRKNASPQAARTSQKPPDILRALSDPRLNAFFADRRFVARVDSHPGSAAISERYGTTALNKPCAGQGLMCIDHTVAQLHELRIVHALATRHLTKLGLWPGAHGRRLSSEPSERSDFPEPDKWQAGETAAQPIGRGFASFGGARGRPVAGSALHFRSNSSRSLSGTGRGGSSAEDEAAAWARLPILKGRPDVLLSEGWKATAGLPRMRKAFATAGGRSGVPGGNVPRRWNHGDSAGPRTNGLGLAGGRVLGHTGPWTGGFGDIAWAMPLGTFGRLISDGNVGYDRLASLLTDDSVGGFSTFKPLVRAKQSGMYHAEQAWREILLKSGVRSFVTGWFAGLAKARLARAPDGTLSIEKWHCYRAAAWDELKPWLAAKGFADEWAPITLPSLPS